jgi:hypothetical protein
MRTVVRPPPKAKSKLKENVEIAEWPRNSRGQTIRVSLRSYGGHPLLDVRTSWTGTTGRCTRAKVFSCRLKDLPRLAQAVTEALKRARMLGLVADEGEGSE